MIFITNSIFADEDENENETNRKRKDLFDDLDRMSLLMNREGQTKPKSFEDQKCFETN